MPKITSNDQSRFGAIVKLGWVSFFTDIASETIYPIIPLFLINSLKAPIQVLGVVEGMAEALVSILKGWSGLHFDRTGKRLPFIVWGYSLGAFGKPLMALATAWPLVLVARLTDRFGKGLRTTARDAVIADAAGKDMLGKAYGLHRGMDTAGAFVGVALVLLLLTLHWSYRAIFIAAAFPGLISVAITLTLKDPRPPKEKATPEHRPRASARIRELPAGYWRAVFLTVLFAVANSSDQFLLLRANGVGFSVRDVVVGYLLYNFTYTVLSYPAGLLSEKIGRWPLLAMGWTIYGGVYWAFGHATGALIWGLFALYGCYMGLTDGVSKALVASYSAEGSRGVALGFYFMACGFAAMLGNVLSGVLWRYCGPTTMFTTCSVLAGAAVILIPVTGRFWPMDRKVV